MSTTTSYQMLPSGGILKALREGAGLSLRELATTITTANPERPVSHGHLGRVEAGERPVTAPLATRIARAVADRMAGVTA